MNKNRKMILKEPNMNPIMTQQQTREIKQKISAEIEEETEAELRRRELQKFRRGYTMTSQKKNVVSWKTKLTTDDPDLIMIDREGILLWNKPENVHFLPAETREELTKKVNHVSHLVQSEQLY